MTVAELIVELQKQRQDAEVGVCTSCCCKRDDLIVYACKNFNEVWIQPKED